MLVSPCKSDGKLYRQEIADGVAPLSLLIYRKALQTSDAPEDRRKANVTHVFKKGQCYQAENYRPI